MCFNSLASFAPGSRPKTRNPLDRPQKTPDDPRASSLSPFGAWPRCISKDNTAAPFPYRFSSSCNSTFVGISMEKWVCLWLCARGHVLWGEPVQPYGDMLLYWDQATDFTVHSTQNTYFPEYLILFVWNLTYDLWNALNSNVNEIHLGPERADRNITENWASLGRPGTAPRVFLVSFDSRGSTILIELVGLFRS